MRLYMNTQERQESVERTQLRCQATWIEEGQILNEIAACTGYISLPFGSNCG